MDICSRLNNSPLRDVLVSIPETCRYVTFQNKRNLSWGGVGRIILNYEWKGEAERDTQRNGNMRKTQSIAAGFEDRYKGLQVKECFRK